MMITIDHVRAYGYCGKVSKEFADQHNINWWSFLRHGVDSDILIATGNALVIELVKKVQENEHGHG